MKSAGCALIAMSLTVLMPSAPSAAADAEAGKVLSDSDCTNCHTLRKSETQKRGPHLENLFARRYASVEGFEYRMVWTKADLTWTPEQLDAYLDIHGRFEREGRADLIEFLKEATKTPTQ